MENLATIVGKNIACLRKARGLTQQELAYEINYSDGWTSNASSYNSNFNDGKSSYARNPLYNGSSVAANHYKDNKI